VRGGDALRNLARAAVVAIGAVYAWHNRFYVNPDGVAYFDVADTFLARGWFASIHTHRSPLFPWLLAMANRLVRPRAYDESTVAHGVMFLLYCLAFVALECLLAQLRKAKELEGMPDALWIPLAYGLFLWSCNFADETGPSLLTPDLLVAAAVFAGSALLVRIAGGARGWPAWTALGLVVGLGYLAKEAMLPIAIFLLAAAAIAGGRRVLLSAVLFAAIACAYIVPLSIKLGHFSTGETKRYNLIMWVAAEGKPIHAVPVLFRNPTIVGYPDGAGRGMTSVHDDLRYWLEGVRPRFDLRAQLRAIGKSAVAYVRILGAPLHFALLAVFLVLLGRFGAASLKRFWVLTVPSLLTLAMYGAVLVQPRYIAPSLTVLWIGLFAGFGAEAARFAARATAVLSIVVVLVAGYLNRDELRQLFDPAVNDNWLVAQALARAGVRPGDRVASVGEPFMCYWARLAKVRIAAEVRNPATFWKLDATTRAAAEAAVQRYRVRALVAENAPDEPPPEFESVDETSYAVCVLPVKR